MYGEALNLGQCLKRVRQQRPRLLFDVICLVKRLGVLYCLCHIPPDWNASRSSAVKGAGFPGQSGVAAFSGPVKNPVTTRRKQPMPSCVNAPCGFSPFDWVLQGYSSALSARSRWSFSTQIAGRPALAFGPVKTAGNRCARMRKGIWSFTKGCLPEMIPGRTRSPLYENIPFCWKAANSSCLQSRYYEKMVTLLIHKRIS